MPGIAAYRGGRILMGAKQSLAGTPLAGWQHVLGRRRVMLDNATYNLMETATVISKGLHRYGTFQSDAKNCQHCQQIWNEMKQADEKQLEKIVGHLHQHMKEGATKAA
jgi:hypothetical protein